MKYFRYNIVSHKGYDVNKIGIELTEDSGSDCVPHRQVKEGHIFASSKRISQFLLTKQEAKDLKNDPRILDVELNIEDNKDIEIAPIASYTGDFRRGFFPSDYEYGSSRNWGLKRSSTRDINVWNADRTISEQNSTVDLSLSGHGVDLVVMDQGFVDHPDFHDENGKSRLIKKNWLDEYKKHNPEYVDDSGYKTIYHLPENYYVEDISDHGTSCASIASGNRHGHAKNANIYGIRLNLGTAPSRHNFSILESFNLIKDWHLNKDSDNPTVVSCSFSMLRIIDFDDVETGSFTDSDDEAQTWFRNSRSNETIKQAYNIKVSNKVSSISAGINTIIEELIEAGVHVVIGAGNHAQRLVPPEHPEYNNYFIHDGATIYYNRVGSPYGTGCILVGGLDSITQNGKEKIIGYSVVGELVDIYAPADECIAAASGSLNYPTYPYDIGSDYVLRRFGGTSCAAPQVAGLVAIHAGVKPKLSPHAMKSRILGDATTNIMHEEQTFYTNNYKVFYNRYNQFASVTYSNQDIENVSLKPALYMANMEHGWKAETYGYFVYSGSQQGSLSNDDTSEIYPNSKIKNISHKRRYFSGRGYAIRLSLVFDGDHITNDSWEILEHNARIADGEFKTLKLYRKDAIYSEINKAFYWFIDGVIFRHDYHTGSNRQICRSDIIIY